MKILGTDKQKIQANFIPTIQDSEQDKASIAGLCRTTAEKKLIALSYPFLKSLAYYKRFASKFRLKRKH